MKKIATLTFIFTLTFNLLGQSLGYNINLKFENGKDSTYYLAYYQFDKNYLADSCKNVKNGQVIFSSTTALEPGMYYVVTADKMRLFDFVVTKANQKFTITANLNDMLNTLSSNNQENKNLFEYIKYVAKKGSDFNSFKAKAASMNKKDSTKFMNESVQKMNAEIKAFDAKFIETNKNTFVGNFILFKSEKEPTTPLKLKSGKPDTLGMYMYYKNHYWDGANFAEEGMLRTPVFADKLSRYFTSVIIQDPDTIIKEIDKILTVTPKGELTQKFLIGHFLYTYESSKKMGFDKVFVHIIDKYVNTGLAKEVYDAATITKIKERGDVLRPLLLGAQAPDLLMVDTTGQKVVSKMGFDTVKTSEGATALYHKNIQAITANLTSMYSLNAEYTILVFWDVDCGHCRTEIPKLNEIYKELLKEKIDVKVYCAYTKSDFEKYKQFIIDNKLNWINVYDPIYLNNIKDKYDIYSTPVIYILDKNKRIKAKRIGVEDVKKIIHLVQDEEKRKAPKK